MNLLRIGKRIVNLDTIVEIEANDDGDVVMVSMAPGVCDQTDEGEITGPHLIMIEGEEAVLLWAYLLERADAI